MKTEIEATSDTQRQILGAIVSERRRQDEKHGFPIHRIDGSSNDYENRSIEAHRLTDLHTREDRLTWADVLLEEVYEALAEENPDKLRAELIQVAASAMKWIEAIDLRRQR